MKKLGYFLLLLIAVGVITFLITSGVMEDDNADFTVEVIEEPDELKQKKKNYKIVDFKIEHSKDNNLETGFEVDESKYIDSEDDISYTELITLVEGIEGKDEITEVLKQIPVSLKDGEREDIYVLGKAITYKEESKILEEYKKDLLDERVNIILYVIYNEDKKIIDYTIYKMEDSKVIEHRKRVN